MREGIVVCSHVKLNPIQIIVELINYGPFQGEKFQLVNWVVALCITQLTTCKCHWTQTLRVLLIKYCQNRSMVRQWMIWLKAAEHSEVQRSENGSAFRK